MNPWPLIVPFLLLIVILIIFHYVKDNGKKPRRLKRDNLEEDSNVHEVTVKKDGASIKSQSWELVLIIVLILAIVAIVALNIKYDNNPKHPATHNNTVKISFNNKPSDSAIRKKPQLVSRRLLAITNYPELNDLVTNRLDKLILNYRKDTLRVTFAYPKQSCHKSKLDTNFSSYSSGILLVYLNSGEISLDTCRLPYIPEFTNNSVNSQVRKNIIFVVRRNIRYICLNLNKCLSR